jgi:hypothetical protein
MDSESAAEASYSSGEDEKVTIEMHSSAAGHCHLEKNDGGDTMTSTGAG